MPASTGKLWVHLASGAQLLQISGGARAQQHLHGRRAPRGPGVRIPAGLGEKTWRKESHPQLAKHTANEPALQSRGGGEAPIFERGLGG